MQVLKDLTLGTDISRPYVTTLEFEGGELFSVFFFGLQAAIVCIDPERQTEQKTTIAPAV